MISVSNVGLLVLTFVISSINVSLGAAILTLAIGEHWLGIASGAHGTDYAVATGVYGIGCAVDNGAYCIGCALVAEASEVGYVVVSGAYGIGYVVLFLSCLRVRICSVSCFSLSASAYMCSLNAPFHIWKIDKVSACNMKLRFPNYTLNANFHAHFSRMTGSGL